MNPQWDTPPNGDFASYVERLTEQAALRTLAQRAQHGMQVQQQQDLDAPEPKSPGAQTRDDEAVARARALFAAPGRQLPGEHPLARGLRLALKKLENSLLQGIAQQPKK